MATKQKEAPKTKASRKPANDGRYWVLCAKRGCGLSVKRAPINLDAKTGKAYHVDLGHEPKGFVAKGEGRQPEGYKSEKHGDTKAAVVKAEKARKPKPAPKKRAPKKATKKAA